jgi:hypothetical protein
MIWVTTDNDDGRGVWGAMGRDDHLERMLIDVLEQMSYLGALVMWYRGGGNVILQPSRANEARDDGEMCGGQHNKGRGAEDTMQGNLAANYTTTVGGQRRGWLTISGGSCGQQGMVSAGG